LYKYCKELDHPEFDSQLGQGSFLFIKRSGPSLRTKRSLNGEKVLSLEVKRTVCEADHSLLSGAELKNELNTVRVQDRDNFILRSRVCSSGKVT